MQAGLDLASGAVHASRAIPLGDPSTTRLQHAYSKEKSIQSPRPPVLAIGFLQVSSSKCLGTSFSAFDSKFRLIGPYPSYVGLRPFAWIAVIFRSP